MCKILIIDDDPAFRVLLTTFLEKKGIEIFEASSAKLGAKMLEKHAVDLVLTDLRLPDFSGIDLLQQLRNAGNNVPVILLTGYADIRTAVNAIKQGAFEYVTKPVNPDELLIAINNALSYYKKPAAGKSGKPSTFHYVGGESEAALKIQEYIQLIAPTNMSVIIQGESGTGKEYVARSIHNNSDRANASFVAIDCGALSKDLASSELFGHVKGAFTSALQEKKGQFELASGGTLFLDEIGNLSYEVQVKLLRAIQERKIKRVGGDKYISVDVRIIVATNENLSTAVKNGEFREDLFHRLNEFVIEVPALRSRGEDVLLFTSYFLKMANEELGRQVEGYDDETRELLLSYSWPGNLRELKNTIKRAVLLCKGTHINPTCLPAGMEEEQYAHKKPAADLKALVEQNEREMIVYTLEKVNNNKSKAAKILNIDRKTLYNKLKLYEIEN